MYIIDRFGSSLLSCVAKQLRECKYMKKIEQLEPFTT